MPEMQEQFPAGAWQATIPNNEALLLARQYAENAGAFFGGCLNGRTPQNESW
ncbi:MAG TPA: hypothetical protein VFI49_12535 [Rudaea sp.]|nr:hypothetical protein [Rudaea sp.]